MPVSVGTAFVDIKPDLSGFGRELDTGVERSSSGAGQKAGGAMAGGFKKAAGLLAGAFATVQVGSFLKDSIGAASDLEESLSKVGVVFGDQAGQIESFAKDAATSLGIPRQAALEATSTLGNLFVAMGIGQGEAVTLSTGMTTLASDLASFNNASPEETLNALRSGLLGETEPLKRFGVNLNAARIEAEAFAIGIAKPAKNAALIEEARLKTEKATKALTEAEREHGKDSEQAVKARADLAKAEGALEKATKGSKVELTAAQKAQAAYSLIMKDTETAQGDFARTSDGLANKQRILSAQFQDVKTRIGQGLLPVALTITTFLSNNLMPAFEGVGRVVGQVAGWVGNLVDRFRSGGDSMGETGTAIAGVFESIKAVVESVFEALKAIFDTYVAILTDIWDRFGGTIIEYFKGTWEFITEALRGVFQVVSGIFDLFKAILTGKWGEAWDAVKKIFDGVWDTLWAVIRNVFTNILPTVFGLAQAALSAGWSLLWNSLKTLFTDLWQGPAGIFNWIKDRLGDLVGIFTELPGRLARAAAGLFDWFKDLFLAAYRSVRELWNNIDFTLPEIDLPGPLGSIGGQTIGMPDLPELAGGGRITREGWGIAGERGAELIQFPRGAQVAPLERDLEPASGPPAPLIGEFNLNGSNLSPWDVADEIGWLMRTTGR